ncbi:hypothetical protein MRBLWH7_001678 [Microbacterium sp. LWH7-1.2]|uniref:hypothetical protein n=1 Tax=Microbacterium sp. LWH7-1.2 TaxID=3135257 RepID=UPI003138F4F6
MLGVFVLENRNLHVHVRPTASRLRSPHDRRKRITALRRRGVKLHWTDLLDECGRACATGVLDALAHAIRCQNPTAAVATLDSALNKKLIAEADLARVFAALPARFQVLASFVDARAESGPETFVRLMARRLGCDIQLQVKFAETGRVDLVLDGWLVVEWTASRSTKTGPRSCATTVATWRSPPSATRPCACPHRTSCTAPTMSSRLSGA